MIILRKNVRALKAAKSKVCTVSLSPIPRPILIDKKYLFTILELKLINLICCH